MKEKSVRKSDIGKLFSSKRLPSILEKFSIKRHTQTHTHTYIRIYTNTHTQTHTHTHLSLNLKREDGVLKGGNGHPLIHSKQCPPGTPARLEQSVFFSSLSNQKNFLRFYDKGNVRPNVRRMKCLDQGLANLTLFAKKLYLWNVYDLRNLH